MAKTKNDDEYLNNLRHSCAHLLAAAVMKLYPKAKRTIGPSIENGFYYDFDDLKISEEDLPKIEAKMHDLVKNWQGFERTEVTIQEAKKTYKDNPYKLELIEEFSSEGQKLTFYKSGDYSDLCRGGHIEKPAEELQFFKLLKIAGAYWRGSEKNKMLTRIYGTAFPTQKELDQYLWQQQEAEKRDHKKIGRELELFMFHETAPGMPYWLPRGVILYNELIKFWREEHVKRGYQEIVSPILNKKELYVTSGHYDHYWNDMFVAKTSDEGEYGVKAMNCPNAHVVFASKNRSYKELPLRLSDTDTLHRYEPSGTINGLLRVREFRQDDAHIYVSQDQIVSEYNEVFDIVKKFYSVFGIEYSFRLGTRNPQNYMGDIDTWNQAEATLKKILDDSGVTFSVLDGDGAFYGPKVDILMKDALGRQWQMGTVQLDFQQPRRFNLEYAAADGSRQTPIAIHRVVYGSLERFIGIIIEHFAGAFPTWLAPLQTVILPIADRHIEYAKSVESALKSAEIRVEIDDRTETLSAKIRDAQMQKIPYMMVLGDKELATSKQQLASVRSRDRGDLGQLELQKFIEDIKIEIKEKTLNTNS